MSAASVVTTLSAKDAGLRQALDRSGPMLDGFAKKALAVAGVVGGMFAGVKLIQGAVNLGRSMISLAADAETAAIGFEVMLGSAEKARTVMGDLQKFAAATPFEFPELRDASRSLLAFGVASEQLVPTMRMLGDLASGLNIPIGELAQLYGKAKVQGRAFGEDINQLQGRGINITKELAKQFGVAQSEVKKLVEAGKVGFPEIGRALQSLATDQFGGMMERQSKTFTGLWSTMSDTIGEIGRKMGEALLPIMKSLVNLGDAIAGVFGKMADGEIPTVKDALTKVADVIDAIAQSVRAINFDSMGDGLSKLWDRLSEGFRVIGSMFGDIITEAAARAGRGLINAARESAGLERMPGSEVVNMGTFVAQRARTAAAELAGLTPRALTGPEGLQFVDLEDQWGGSGGEAALDFGRSGDAGAADRVKAEADLLEAIRKTKAESMTPLQQYQAAEQQFGAWLAERPLDFGLGDYEKARDLAANKFLGQFAPKAEPEKTDRFQSTFEGLDSLYKRIASAAASDPQEAIKKNTEKMAFGIGELVELAKKAEAVVKPGIIFGGA